MRHTLAIILAVVAAFAINAARPGEAYGLKFEATEFDFGTVKDDVKSVVHEYTFVNTSDEPVAIVSASASCGCTKPKFPAKPIAPGGKGAVTVTFLPAGQKGEVSKEVKVRVRSASSKSSKRLVLKLTGVVIPTK